MALSAVAQAGSVVLGVLISFCGFGYFYLAVRTYALDLELIRYTPTLLVGLVGVVFIIAGLTG